MGGEGQTPEPCPSAGHQTVAIPIDRALGPELVALLASLADQPDDAAEVALSVQSKATILRLISLRVIEPVPAISDEGYVIVLTEHGRAAIRECAQTLPPAEQRRRERAAVAELKRAQQKRRSRVGTELGGSIKRAESRPLAEWFEANAGLLQAVGIVVGVIVAVVIAILTA